MLPPGLSPDHGPLNPITAIADVGNLDRPPLVRTSARLNAAGLWPTYIRVAA